MNKFWLRDALKQALPMRWRRLAQRLGRFRWITKARLLRNHQVHPWTRPLLALRYVFLDPEVESFTYELANPTEMVNFAASALGQDRGRIEAYATEAAHDPELTQPSERRWTSKRRPPLANRLLWYITARAEKPCLIVETGIHEGLGSLVLLRALERNAQEGWPGTLVSFDVFPDTGWRVPDRLRVGWQRVEGSTLTDLDPFLRGRRVEMSVHDASADENTQRAEFSAVLRHAGDRLVIVNGAGADSGVLSTYCDRHGVTEFRFAGRSHNHVHPGNSVAIATFGQRQRGS